MRAKPTKTPFASNSQMADPRRAFYDEELGHITVRCDSPAVREEVSRFYGDMVRATPANRHPSDPLASPKPPMPASFHKVVNARKLASYPKLTRYITAERWQELI